MLRLLSVLVVIAALGCAPEGTAGEADGGAGEDLPVYRGDRPASDGGGSGDDGGDGGVSGGDGGRADAGAQSDAGQPSGCVPEIAGARFGVCAGRITTTSERTVEGARFGVTGSLERAPATAGGGRFGVTGGEIHVP